MSARLHIDPSTGTIATLGRFAHYIIAHKAQFRITACSQQVMHCERLIIQDAANWILHDLAIGGRSQLQSALSGELPGELFATTARDNDLAVEALQVGLDLVLTVSNVGNEPRQFRAVMLGRDAVTNARVVLPLTSAIPIEPRNDPDEEAESPGDHVIVEIDDVLHHVTFGGLDNHHVAMTKVQDSDLSARALEEIDRNLDLRPSPTVVTLRALKPVGWQLDLTKMGERAGPYPYGLIMFDETLGAPILTLGDVVHDGKTVAWNPAGLQLAWLAAPTEDLAASA